MTLDLLAEQARKIHGVRSGELLSGNRRQEMVESRREISGLSVKELGYSRAEVARYLGVTNAWVPRTESARGVPNREKYLWPLRTFCTSVPYHILWHKACLFLACGDRNGDYGFVSVYGHGARVCVS